MLKYTSVNNNFGYFDLVQVEKQHFGQYIGVHIDFEKDMNFVVLLPNCKDHISEHLRIVVEWDFHICRLVFHEHQQVFQTNRLKFDEVLQTIPWRISSKQIQKRAF